MQICYIEYNAEARVLYAYIEDYTSVWIVTKRHNCDGRKDSDQSNHTIVNFF